MTTFTTFLWFDTQAEEAAECYTSIFEDGRITGTRRYSPGGPVEASTITTVTSNWRGRGSPP